MNCTILIKKRGQLKYDWTGTIREAIKDWDLFYRAVFNHVKDCDKCNPDDVLRAYWKLRQSPKHGGRTSIGLAALAYRYRRIGANEELVKKFIAASSNVIKYAHLFDDRELYEVICKETNEALTIRKPGAHWPYTRIARELRKLPKKKTRPFFEAIACVFEACMMPPYEDVERLAVVAEVALS